MLFQNTFRSYKILNILDHFTILILSNMYGIHLKSNKL